MDTQPSQASAQPATAGEQFDEQVEALLVRLKPYPWDIKLLDDLRALALRRKAAGIPDREVRSTQSSDVHALIEVYRQIAWQPTRSEPLLALLNLLKRMQPRLSTDGVNRCKQVTGWANALLRKMADGGN